MTTFTRKTTKSIMHAQSSTSPVFESLFQENWTRIYNTLFRLVGDPAEAEDLALEVFLRLHKQPGLLENPESIGGWLYRVATNLGYNALRASRRRTQYELSAGKNLVEDHHGSEPASEIEKKIEREQVRYILAQMKPRSAKLLFLRHSGLSYAELASALKIAPGSVGKFLSRAEKDFEKRYKKHFEE